MINKDDPFFKDKTRNLVISKIINSESDKEIVSFLQLEFGVKLDVAKRLLGLAKRALKFYKSADMETSIKIHSQRYELIAEYCRRFGMANLLLRTVRAHCLLLGMKDGEMGVAMRGASVISLDRNRATGSSSVSSDEILLNLSEKDRLFLVNVLTKMRRGAT